MRDTPKGFFLLKMNHSFDVDIARAHGVEAAIIIENFRFWIAKNKANGRHFYDGRWWTYNSSKAMAELFPYWSAKQIERIIAKLKDAGILLVGHYSQNAYDRTNWYSIEEIDFPKLAIPFPEIGKSTRTDINTDNTKAASGRFEDFWKSWPSNERKQDKAKCLSKWVAMKLDTVADKILSDIAVKQKTQKWRDGYIEAPIVYINGRRWEDGVQPDKSASSFAGLI